jgi:hypothetical protein
MTGLSRISSALMVAAAVLSVAAVRAQVVTGQGTVVRGRVVTGGDNPRPLRGALVESASLRDPVLTDVDGRFEVPAAARYSLTITKPGYAPAIVSGSGPAPVERVIALAPGSVLTGVVVDASGFPVPDALVRARPIGAAPDVGQALGVLVAETDEAGQFRLGSLPAGRYAINTEVQFRRRVTDMAHALVHEMAMRELEPLMRRNALAMSDVVTVSVGPGEEVAATLVHQRPAVSDVDAPIAGAVSGSIVDGFGEPVQGVTVALWRLRFAGDRQQALPTGVQRRSDDRGQYRIPTVPPGRYLLVASLEESPYTPLYFPGVAAIAAAAPVVVGPRAEVHGIDVTFTRTRAARVTGRALDSRGQPLVGLVVLTPRHAPPAPAVLPRAVAVSGDATFEFTSLPPGDYVLRAMRAGAGEPVAEFTMRTITVGDVDPPAIVLATSPTASLRGRIVIEGPDIPAADLGLMALADADAGPLSGRPWPASVTGATFELRGLAGPTRISLSRAPAGYWLKSVDVAGVNAAITPVSFDGPDDSRADVVAVVSTIGGGLTGRVADDAGRAVESYRVVVFSTDQDQWFAGSPAVRITGGPEVDGTYSVRSLPPGDYWAVAVDIIDGDGDSGDWQNPDVLARLAPLASRVSVAAGQRATVALRLRQWGQ